MKLIMKNIFYLMSIIFMISCVKTKKIAMPVEEKAENSELVDTQNQYIFKNPLYVDYKYNFEPLCDDEILIYSYSYGYGVERYKFNNEEYMYRLSAKNTVTAEERILGCWNVIDGECMLSHNRKSCTFVLQGSESLFKVDAQNGSVKYLFDKTYGAYMSTSDLHYFLFHFDGRGLFILVDLEKNEYVRSVEWRKSDGAWGDGLYRIFRSLDPQFDFRIDFSPEGGYIHAIAYYNIEHNQLETVFDITDQLPHENARRHNIQAFEELGWDP